MYISKRILFIFVTVLALSLLATFTVLAGNINSSAAPNATSSYTLADIYNRLNAGTAGTPSTFTEPASGPGSTMADLNTIMGAAPAVDDSNGATAAEVANGKTFWGLTSGQWGVQTGTMSDPLARFIVPSIVVPKTGQIVCYDSAGSVISCTGTGQDGEYQLGISPTLPPTAPGTTTGAFNTPAWTGKRFTDNGNGTVTDNLTTLIWLKNANCFGVKPWATALSDVNGLATGACGLTDGSSDGDWRLPNINELHSLIDLSQSNPALTTGHPFSAVQLDGYWSSTSEEAFPLPNYAWGVYLLNGIVGYSIKSGNFYVWPVQAGK